ncbi:hypothetical protein IE81DRAFT_20760 [Ceraceosorus guamensis]|uniref:Uncharacterized protein n=1 Tax=Ceraceosorus guamensis TaxID=1522189 RepID=A0A316W409_9BASI|nr:hypothetical protein IE81DRAFT_20760 [Ceraceosorus guamensis]PWN44459.1 hypothetical protein IE81DRAFT_20760 [Ceraceosorus guamensis]
MKNLGSDDNVVQYGHSDAHGSDAYGPNLAGQGLSHMRSMDSHMYPHNGARSVPGWSAHGDEQVAPDPQQYGYDPTYGGYDAYGGYYDAGQQPPPASYDAHGPGYEVMMPPSQEYGGNSLSAHSSPATGPVHVTGPGGLGYSTSVNARSGAGGHSLSNSISMRSMSNQPHAQAYSNDMPMMEHSNSSAAHLARQASAGTAYSYPSDHQHNARPPMPQRSGTTLNVVQPAGGHYGPHHGGELSRTGTPDDTALEPPRGPLHVVNNGE